MQGLRQYRTGEKNEATAGQRWLKTDQAEIDIWQKPKEQSGQGKKRESNSIETKSVK